MSDTVAKQSDEVAAMVSAAAKGRALMGGTQAMRKGAETYLPKFKAEAQEDYLARLDSSWLFNGFKKTVLDMTGRVFEKAVEVPEAPDQIKDWCENIDMQGRDLSVFASEVFKDGFASGVSFIMADAPQREAETTIDAAAALGLRPYLVHLRVEDVLGWKTDTYGNVLAFSQFRILETVSEPDPEDEFKQVDVQQVRILDRTDKGVAVRIYRENQDSKWVQSEAYPTDAPEITVVPYYARRTGFATGEPVIEDLADVNIAHWQSQSDQRNILHFARVPILFGAGFTESDGSKEISAGKMFSANDYQAKLEWVEHGGQAIGAGRQDLKDLEYQMQTLGLSLIAEKVKSATGEARDASKETSQLAMMADSLKDALEQALLWVGMYGGVTADTIGVEMNKDFGTAPMTPEEVKVLQADVALGLLSKQEYYEERKRRGVLRPDLDTQADIDKVEAEGPELGGDGGFA